MNRANVELFRRIDTAGYMHERNAKKRDQLGSSYHQERLPTHIPCPV